MGAFRGGGGGAGLVPLVLFTLVLFSPVGKAILDLGIFVVGLSFFLPFLAFAGLNWYAKLNTFQAPCPVCGVNVTGFKNGETPCLSCGTVLVAEDDGTSFRRKTPSFDGGAASSSGPRPFSSSGSSRPGGRSPTTGRRSFSEGRGTSIDVDADVTDA